jgi:hypothetical protein
MKNITRSRLYIPVAVMLLGATWVAGAAAQNQVPFKGTMQGQDVDLPNPPPNSFVVATTGTGNATQLGQFAFLQQVTVNGLTGTDTGFAHWIAANRDTIDLTIVGGGHPESTANGIIFRITEIFTITGGTGRFAGAQGSFKMERVASGDTFMTSGVFQGSITTVGSSH